MLEYGIHTVGKRKGFFPKQRSVLLHYSSELAKENQAAFGLDYIEITSETE